MLQVQGLGSMVEWMQDIGLKEEGIELGSETRVLGPGARGTQK